MHSVNCSEIVMHPLYEFTPQADRYDVALLRLDRPATLMPHIAPVCLPDPGTVKVGHLPFLIHKLHLTPFPKRSYF